MAVDSSVATAVAAFADDALNCSARRERERERKNFFDLLSLFRRNERKERWGKKLGEDGGGERVRREEEVEEEEEESKIKSGDPEGGKKKNRSWSVVVFNPSFFFSLSLSLFSLLTFLFQFRTASMRKILLQENFCAKK